MGLVLFKTVILCVLSVATFFILGSICGSTVKGLWALLTTGAVKEFLSPEGRLCLLMGGLFGILVMLTAFAPDMISIIARMIDPAHFGPPGEVSVVVYWLLFLFFFGNVVALGVLYKQR